MKKFYFIGLLVALIIDVAPLVQQGNTAELVPLTVRDFTCGLKTKQDPTIIGEGCAQDLENVDVHTGSIVTRRGSTLQNGSDDCTFSGQARRFAHEFPDPNGNFWLITVTSNSICQSNDAGVTNTILTSGNGVTVNSAFHAVNAFGKVRLTDGTTDWILFDGSAVTTSTASPKGTNALFWLERIWTSVGSVLHASRFGDPEDWTDDGLVDTDAFSENIRLNDGYSIRKLIIFRNSMLIFKDFSIDLLNSNDGGATFVRSSLIDTLGTQSQDSVVVRDNDVVWLGHDNYYSFTGSQIIPISEPIKSTIKSIKQLNSFQRSQAITTQAGFDAGEVPNQLSTVIFPGNIVLSTWTRTDTIGTDFGLGTLTGVTTGQLDGVIQLSTTNTNTVDNGFETNTFGWSFDGRWARTNAASGQKTGTWFAIRNGPTDEEYGIHIVDSDGNPLLTVSTFTPSATATQRSQVLSAVIGRNIRIKLVAVDDNSDILISTSFYCSGTTLTWDDWSQSGTGSIAVDNFLQGRSTTTHATFTSQVFDTVLSSPAWIESNVLEFLNSNTIVYTAESSTATDGVFTSASWTDGTAPNTSNERYFRYTITIDTASNSTSLPYISSITFNARQSSGIHTSQAINVGSNITSWNTFKESKSLNNGSISFAFYTDTDTNHIDITDTATFTSSQTITNLTVPSVSTAVAVYITADFSVTFATDKPILADYTIQWNEGESNFVTIGIHHDGDYICAVALSSETGNDSMLIYDRNGSWTKYTNLEAHWLTIYRQNPYFTSNLNGDIVRFQVDDKNQDFDATAIESFWTSKEYDFDLPLTDKTITRYYVTATRVVNSTVAFSYGVNRGAKTEEELNLDLLTGFFRKAIRPASDSFKRGITHSIKFANDVVDNFFKILSFTIKARTETSP